MISMRVLGLNATSETLPQKYRTCLSFPTVTCRGRMNSLSNWPLEAASRVVLLWPTEIERSFRE